MPQIENVPVDAIFLGTHRIKSDNKILISITDLLFKFEKPKDSFVEIHHFKFADICDPKYADPTLDGFAITQVQADRLVKILQDALDKDLDVVVHCHAGICRSGAVVEVAVMMGFNSVHSTRIPNTLVKRLMMKSLGWTYEEGETDV